MDWRPRACDMDLNTYPIEEMRIVPLRIANLSMHYRIVNRTLRFLHDI